MQNIDGWLEIFKKSIRGGTEGNREKGDGGKEKRKEEISYENTV